MKRGVEGSNFFGYSLAHYYVFGNHRPGVTDVWKEYTERREQAGFSPEAVFAAANSDRLGAKVVEQGLSGLRGAVGTPEQIRDFLKRYEECGVDQIIFVSQAGKNKHEDIMESLELFGTKVMPEFLERDPKLEQEKRKRLEPVLEKAMKRKPAEDHPPLPSDDYAFPAIPRAMAERAGPAGDQFLSQLETIANQRAVGDRTPLTPGARPGIV
jgi:hypothetical protein